MIIAIPAPPTTKNPTLRHLKEFREICMRHGFMTYPQFLDNNFISNKNKADTKWLERNLKRFGEGIIRFAISPDYMIKEAIELKNSWPEINWVYPLHKRHEDISEFEWVGFIHDAPRRDYDLKTFLNTCKEKKKWYLGYWDSQPAVNLFLFNGVDTTMLNAIAGKYGMIWRDWGKKEQIGGINIRFNELFEFNLLSFKIALTKLQENTARNTTLSQFLTNDEKENE